MAAMNMAEIVGEDLGPDICTYNDRKLRKELRRRPPVKYKVLPLTHENCAEGAYCSYWAFESGTWRCRGVDTWSDSWTLMKNK